MKNPELKISFKKFLRNQKGQQKGQSAIEYSLLLVVIAVLVLGFFADNFRPIREIFEGTTDNLIDRILE